MLREIVDHELAGFNKLFQKDRQIRNLIVVGGNLLEVIRPTEKGNKKFASISGDNFQKFYERITVMRPEEIAAEFSLPQDAAAEGATAMVLCKVLMENFGVDTVWLPGFSLSDGLAYHYGEEALHPERP